MKKYMLTNYHRFFLGVVLVFAIFNVFSILNKPFDCYLPPMNGECNCQKETSDNDKQNDICLTCLQERSTYSFHLYLPNYPKTIFLCPLNNSIIKAAEPAFSVFHPPISQL